MMPAVGVLLPVYLLFRTAGLLDSVWGLILICALINLPIAVWMSYTYFCEIPAAILEAARVDGAGVWNEIWHILAPLALPGIASTALLLIILSWNEAFWTINLTSAKAAPLTVFIASYSSPEGLFWAKLSAASLLAVAPIMVMGWLTQKQLVSRPHLWRRQMRPRRRSVHAPNDGSVRLRGLVKTYLNDQGHPTVTAVKGLNLDIAHGEFMVLVGPSGCGKSTTLRMIAGLEQITSGTIEIGGQVVNQLAPKDRGIAMVFQNYALYPHMTVFDNLAFGLKLAKHDKRYIRETVLRAAAALDLDQLLDRKPQALSGGQRQRVALGRAIVRNPKVFLFDEPLSNLDAKMRVQMRAEISRLHVRLKTTMIYVTHDQVEAMTLGDRICVMRDGVIMQVADPLTLYRQPQNLFVAGFIGSPPMNLLPGRIQRQPAGLCFLENGGSGALTIPLQGRLGKLAASRVDREVVFGVRPEHLSATAPGAVPVPAAFTVEFAEQMGAESILHLKGGARGLIARVFGEHRHQPGEPFTARLQLDHVHLFDPQTGNRLAED